MCSAFHGIEICRHATLTPEITIGKTTIDTPQSAGYHTIVLFPPCFFAFSSAGVAQLVEQRFRKPQVVGSIPIAGSITPSNRFTC